MKVPELDAIYFHTDYDGIVSAAMLLRPAIGHPSLIGVDYELKPRWSRVQLGNHSAVVDFLYHPAAAVWFDHHSMPFVESEWQSLYHRDAYHRWDPNALACPPVIAESIPIEECVRQHFTDYIHWSEIIDGARYESAAQAHDLTNPHIVLSRVIAVLRQPDALASIVRMIAWEPAESVLVAPSLEPVIEAVMEVEQRTRRLLAPRIIYDGRVAFLDQADTTGPYDRYLPYLFYPDAAFVVGIYRKGGSFNISVGANPWRPMPALHIGELCQKWGGGGHAKVGGVTVHAYETALEVAHAIRDQLAFADLHCSKTQ